MDCVVPFVTLTLNLYSGVAASSGSNLPFFRTYGLTPSIVAASCTHPLDAVKV